MEIQGKSILVQVRAKFESVRVQVIRSQLFLLFKLKTSFEKIEFISIKSRRGAYNPMYFYSLQEDIGL